MRHSADGQLEALAQLGDPTRRRLYDHIVESGSPVSRDEAATAVGITRALAAYHLERLLRAGLLTASYARRSGRSGPGAGRTAKLYAPATSEVQASAPPRDYRRVAAILAAAIDAGGKSGTRAAAERIAYADGRAAAHPDADPIAVLAEQGYRPVREGTVVRLANCPFRHLVDEHRELICGLNLSLVRGLLDGIVAPGLDAVLDPRPGYCCVALRRP